MVGAQASNTASRSDDGPPLLLHHEEHVRGVDRVIEPGVVVQEGQLVVVAKELGDVVEGGQRVLQLLPDAVVGELGVGHDLDRAPRRRDVDRVPERHLQVRVAVEGVETEQEDPALGRRVLDAADVVAPVAALPVAVVAVLDRRAMDGCRRRNGGSCSPGSSRRRSLSLPSSQYSRGWTTPSPHPGRRQMAEHPSSATRLPSSHSSPAVDDRVAAPGQRAVGAAAVGDGVVVRPRPLSSHSSPSTGCTIPSPHSGLELHALDAEVAVDRVAVVALLAVLDDAVAADAGVCAVVVAAIVIDVVAVVALLAGVDDAVAADAVDVGDHRVVRFRRPRRSSPHR